MRKTGERLVIQLLPAMPQRIVCDWQLPTKPTANKHGFEAVVVPLDLFHHAALIRKCS